jgi:hypothetical protein
MIDQSAIDAFISVSSIQFWSEGLLSAVQAQVLKVKPQPSGELLEEVVPLFSAKRENVEGEFNRLLSEWKAARRATSSSTVIAMHPSYQRIIGMGPPALPLILRELGRELDHWFWALKAISGEDPVPLEHLGNFRQMAADWLRWGKEKGYVR